MGGAWRPERLPIYDVLFGIEDWDLMIESLSVIVRAKS